MLNSAFARPKTNGYSNLFHWRSNPGFLLYTLQWHCREYCSFSSPITGILILAGVFIASRKAGAMMDFSGLIGAGVAILAGAPYDLVTFGLFGYNSILTGMAFWSGPFVKANKATFFISVFGAAITAFTWMAFSHLMGDMFLLGGPAGGWAIPGFTSSFIFTTWALMYASKRFGHDIWPEAPPLLPRRSHDLKVASQCKKSHLSGQQRNS